MGKVGRGVRGSELADRAAGGGKGKREREAGGLTRKRSSQGLCRSWIICSGVPCSRMAVIPPAGVLSRQ